MSMLLRHLEAFASPLRAACQSHLALKWMLFAGGKVIAITQENKTTNVETVNSFFISVCCHLDSSRSRGLPGSLPLWPVEGKARSWGSRHGAWVTARAQWGAMTHSWVLPSARGTVLDSTHNHSTYHDYTEKLIRLKWRENRSSSTTTTTSSLS